MFQLQEWLSTYLNQDPRIMYYHSYTIQSRSDPRSKNWKVQDQLKQFLRMEVIIRLKLKMQTNFQKNQVLPFFKKIDLKINLMYPNF